MQNVTSPHRVLLDSFASMDEMNIQKATGFTLVRCNSRTAGTSEEDAGSETSMAPTQKDKTQKDKARTVCSSDDYYIFLEYLEDRANFEKLFGNGKKTTVGGRMLSRGAVWDIAASEVRALGFQKTTGMNLYKKWNRYFTKYKEAKELESQLGGGLTEEDLEKGITIAEKLNGICDHNFKVDGLMGNRMNVKPLAKTGAMGFQKFFSQTKFPPKSQNGVFISSPTRQTTQEEVTATEEAVGQQTPASPHWVQELSEDGAEDDEDETIASTAGATLDTTTNAGATLGTAAANAVATADTAAANPGVPATVRKSSACEITHKSKKSSALEQGKHQIIKGTIPIAKPSLATVYMESKLQEVELRSKLIEKKVQWKMAEVLDKQEARCDDFKKRQLEIDFEAHQRKIEREEKSIQSMKSWKHAVLEAQRQRCHTGEMAKQNNKVQIILAGWAQQKSQEEIHHMCALLDT